MRRSSRHTRTGLRWVAIAAVILAAAYYLPAVVHVPYLSERGCCSPFDAQTWKVNSFETAEFGSCSRSRMVNDLNRRLAQSRARRADVERLLGRSDGRSRICSDYWLGSCASFLEVGYRAPEMLRICFNLDDTIAYIERRSN